MGPFSSRPRLSVFTFLWLASPLFATILWLFLLMGVLLLPNLLVPLVSARTAAGQLLHICQLWYVVLVLALLAGFPIIFLTGFFACQRLENVPGARKMPVLVLVCLTFPCIFACGIVIQEDLPSPDNPTGICAYLMNIYVRPPFRKQGVATAIVKRLTAIASDRRAGKIYLETTGMARRMYASVGFSEMDGMMILTRRPSSQSESNENRTTKR